LKGWTLESLELATHHGSASSTHFLVVLPESSQRYTRPSPVWVGITSFFFFVLVAFPVGAAWPRVGWGPRILRWGRLPYGIFAGALTVLLITIQCSPWLTRFRVVLSADTLSIWLAVLLAPHTWLAIRWGLRRIKTVEDQPASKQQATSLAVVARAAIVALGVFAIYGIVARTRLRDSYHGNYSGMLLISQQLFEGNPLLASRDDVRKTLVFAEAGGYDAQFMYFAAFDPLMRVFKDRPVMYRQVMDAAPYRFGRIGFTWLTWVLSGGRWEWYPATMVWLVLSSLAAAAFTLSLMAQEQGLNSAIGVLVVAVPGFWLSLLSGLPEPIAAATLLGGLLFLSRGRPWLAGGLFALSLLIRETGVVIVACVVGAALIDGLRHGGEGAPGVREALIVALVAGGALLAWRLYVAWILASDWGLQAIPYNPGLSWPFAGVRDLWRSIADGQYVSSSLHLSRAAIALSLLLIGGFVLALGLAAARRDATSVATLIYAVMAMCSSYAKVWLFVGNTERVTYELFLALALSCLTIERIRNRFRED
jgi:hypothetical protein